MLTIICAVAQNGAIGYKNRLLYHLSADLKRFKALTTGHTIIMGRRTFESLPKGALPNRRNIVLTHDKTFQASDIETFSSLLSALESAKSDEEIFIIGGAGVYAEAVPLSDRLCLTEIQATPDNADVFFPKIDKAEWKEVLREHHDADERNAKPFDFTEYIRK